jgi:hypothetical protein
MSTNQITTKPDAQWDSAGRFSNQAAMKSLYPTSPIHNGTLAPKEITKMGNELLLTGVETTPDFPDGASRDFEGTTKDPVPDLQSVATGGGGLPTTPFVPNLASPGTADLNPANQPANDHAPVGTNPWGTGAPATERDLINSGQSIASNTLKNYKMGRSS